MFSTLTDIVPDADETVQALKERGERILKALYPDERLPAMEALHGMTTMSHDNASFVALWEEWAVIYEKVTRITA
jgi:hypothetical protein